MEGCKGVGIQRGRHEVREWGGKKMKVMHLLVRSVEETEAVMASHSGGAWSGGGDDDGGGGG